MLEVPFPFPFGGITGGVYLHSEEKMRTVAVYMMNGCAGGHQHNVAFQFDGNVVWTTELGMRCISEVLGEEIT